jgi:acetylornithine deacetylase/succinyl-diaminopimelate desuccinylase-like protein
MKRLNSLQAESFIADRWDRSIIDALQNYIRIPCKSPAFDPDWSKNGHIDRAVQCITDWCRAQNPAGLQLSVESAPGRTPLIFIEIDGSPGATERTVMLYGHLDKQPEMEGWDADKGPWEPVLSGDRLYGRGGADDGYAIFAALTAIQTLQQQGIPHCRCVIIIEASEESGSSDLPFYMQTLTTRLGRPDLIICLDSGCGNYDQLWLTTSLRGMVMGELTVQLLKEGVHSGNGSGIVASSFRVARHLIDRLEDARTGEMRLPELVAEVPSLRLGQAKAAAQLLGPEFIAEFPLAGGVQPVSTDPAQLILNRTWYPSLAVTGADGIPRPADAGNVLRPYTTLKLSIRLPPTVSAEAAARAVKQTLETDPPYHSRVEFKLMDGAQGWQAPAPASWLEPALVEASRIYFGAEPMYMGEGGSIPFMNLLSRHYPEAQFIVTGVLGPKANAHGPNEFLHLPTARKLTACVAHIVAVVSVP